MQLHALGGLSLEGTGFTRPKPLLVLAYLVLEGPQQRQDLAALFYPGAASPMRSLASEINRLKKGAPGVIETDGGRVWSEIDCDAQTLLTTLEENDLDKSLELYSGRFLDGLSLKDWSAELEEWVYGTRELLADRVRAALLRLAEEEASEGKFKPAAERAERAYLLSGAPEPKPEDLERLHRLLLAGESPEAAEVRKEAEGYGLDLSPAVEGARAELRTMAAERRAPHNLPAQSTPFIGRRGDIARLHEQLAEADCRLLTIVGPGGIGKTRLALEVARGSLGAFKDGAYFASFVPVTSPELMVYAIADALGLRFFQQNDPQRQLLTFLQEKELLLVLDNLEHLLAGVELLPLMLGAAPGLKLLVTSRERLDLLSERVFDLHGLSFPAGEQADLDGYDAVDLLLKSARNHRSDFVLEASNTAAVARICQLVEGHPLAIELAASWLRVLTPGDIVAELGQGLDILQASARDLPERHRSLRAAFDHSWKLLGDQEMTVLQKLAVFRGGFRREAAREVAGASLLILAGLVDKSLLSVASDGRYALHPLIHEFCQEKLAEQPDHQGLVEELHGLYYLRFLDAQDSALQDIAGRSWRDLFELQREELGNIRAAWSWAVAESRIDEFTRNTRLWAFTFINLLEEGLAFFTQAIAELDRADPSHQIPLGHLLVSQAQIQLWLSKIRGAHDSVREGLKLLRDQNDALNIMQGLLVQGWAWWYSGDYLEAKTTFEEGLSLARNQDSSDYIYFLVGLGAVFQEIEDSAESRHYHQHALDEVRALGNAFNLGNYLINYGTYLVNTGRLEEAERQLGDALGLGREMGDELTKRYSLLYLGRVAWRSGSYEQARRLSQDALTLTEEHGDRFTEAYALADMSRSMVSLGDLPEVQNLVRRSLGIGLIIESPRVMLAALVSLAELRFSQGAAEEAAQWLSLVVSHPATEQFYRVEARRLLETDRSHFADVDLAHAADRANTLRLEQVVTEALTALPAKV